MSNLHHEVLLYRRAVNNAQLAQEEVDDSDKEEDR